MNSLNCQSFIGRRIPCFSSSIRHDEQELCVGRKDGGIDVYKLDNDEILPINRLSLPEQRATMPVMALRYVPPSPDRPLGNIVISAGLLLWCCLE